VYVQIKKIATMHYNDLLALTAAEARDETFLHEQTADHVLRLKIAWLALYHRFGDKCRYEYDGKKDHGGGGGTGDGARRQKMFTPNGNETDAARVQQAQDGKCRNDLDGHGRRNRRGALAAGTRRPASAATTSTVTAAATDAARLQQAQDNRQVPRRPRWVRPPQPTRRACSRHKTTGKCRDDLDGHGRRNRRGALQEPHRALDRHGLRRRADAQRAAEQHRALEGPDHRPRHCDP